MQVTNVAMALPSLPLTIILVAFLDASVWNIILAICITAWTSTARIIRSRVQQLKPCLLYRLSAPWEPAAPIS